MAEHTFMNKSLDFDARTKALIDELTLDEKLLLITGHQGAIPRLGIKETYIGCEVARGLVCRGDFGEEPTTVFPEPFGLAATFDPSVMQSMGEVTGIETRIRHSQGKSSLFTWGPTVDAERHPLWGRNEEGYGEDPFLIGEMSSAFTRGMVGSDENYYRVIPTLKHFYADNNEEDRTCDNACIPIGLKHDYYLKAFEPAVKSGAKSLMTAYNEVNGVECVCNPEVDEICKKQWGLLFAVTDGGDFMQNVQYHKSDKNHTEAIARILTNHGADIMTDDEEVVRTSAKAAVEQGLLKESDIDKAIYGVLKARFMLGEFDEITAFDYPEDYVCSPAHYSAAERAALESVILLRNNRATLPLSKNEKLGVVGIAADMNFRDWYTGLSEKNTTILDAITAYMGRENVIYESGNDVIALRDNRNGFYFSVQEDGTLVCDSATINEACLLEVFDWGDGAVSLKSKVNGKFLSDCGVMRCTSDDVYGWFVREKFIVEKNGRVCFMRNWQNRLLYITEDNMLAVTTDLKPRKSCGLNVELFSSGVERVKRLATEAHNVVVFGGNNPQIGARECTDRKHLSLPERQKKLLEASLTLNERTVLFLISGYPYAIDDDYPTVMHMAHAGPAMGNAVAKTLFGEVSPAGRCPVTWYRSDSDLCDIKDYNIIRSRMTYQYFDGEPQFPFGYGLSYTAFRYGAVKTDKRTYMPDETIILSCEIENVGNITADEVVQVYVAPPRMAKPLPIKQLKAFTRVNVPKGKKQAVMLEIKVSDLSFWDISANDFVVYGGSYELQIGPSSADIRRTVDIRIEAPEFGGIDTEKQVPAAASSDYRGVVFDTDRKLNEYAVIKDWQSMLMYNGCHLTSKNNVEITVSNPGSKTQLTVSCVESGMVLAVVDVPATGAFDEFVTVSAKAEPVNGIFTLRITCGGIVSLKSFRFF